MVKNKGNKIKICLTCGKEFLTWYDKRKYCCTKCFQKAPKTFSHMNLTKEQIYDMYFKQKLSFYKIESQTGISINTIRYWFNKWGFKARNKSEAQSGELNHAYKDGIHSNHYRVYLRDNKKCKICGYDRIINIHHIKQRKDGGKDNLKNLITLCPNCHSLVHSNIIKIFSINKWKDNNKKLNKYKG